MPRGAGTRSLSILRESAIMESMIEKILFTAYLMMVQTLGQGIEVRPMVVTPQLPTLVAEHEETATGVVEDAVPDYMLYQAVRDDIAQYQYGDWSYRLSLQNEIWSKDYIANCGINFTGLKIACIGDSLTEGIGGEKSYPEVIAELLPGATVLNYGIGGSTIGSGYSGSSAPMVDRYTEIPRDVDVIVVCGGVNDSFVVDYETFGETGESYSAEVAELLKGLLRDYPHAKIFCLIPMAVRAFDDVKAQNPNLLTQQVFRREIILRSLAYNIEVIDLYNTNVLNPYDETVRAEFFYDGTHLSTRGYEIMGSIVAVRIAIWANNTGW